jgi:hypothetical protein
MPILINNLKREKAVNSYSGRQTLDELADLQRALSGCLAKVTEKHLSLDTLQDPFAGRTCLFPVDCYEAVEQLRSFKETLKELGKLIQNPLNLPLATWSYSLNFVMEVRETGAKVDYLIPRYVAYARHYPNRSSYLTSEIWEQLETGLNELNDLVADLPAKAQKMLDQSRFNERGLLENFEQSYLSKTHQRSFKVVRYRYGSFTKSKRGYQARSTRTK